MERFLPNIKQRLLPIIRKDNQDIRIDLPGESPSSFHDSTNYKKK